MATVDLAQYESETFDFFSKQAWKEVTCLLCPGKNKQEHIIFDKELMQVARCECGFVFAKRQPMEEALDAFYQKSTAMSVWAEFKKQDFIRQSLKFSCVKDFLVNLKPNAVLDVGAGNGKFLSSVAQWLPETGIMGIDPSKPAVDAAWENAVEVKLGSFDSLSETIKQSFDVITFWGVLEHLSDPKKVLGQAVKKLTKNGHVIVCVPNVDSLAVKTLWKKCFTFCPQHLWYFDIESLSRLMRQFGFQLVEEHFIESEALPILKATFGFDPYLPLPRWAEEKYLQPETLEDFHNMILQTGAGYKIVGVFRHG